MYTIQRHKAKEFILSALKYEHSSIVYKNDIPKIHYLDNTIFPITSDTYVTKYLEDICWYDMEHIGVSSTITHNILKIYGIDNARYQNSSHCIYFPVIQFYYDFYVSTPRGLCQPIIFCIQHKYGDICCITIENDNNLMDSGMLLFMIDPLQAISKMEYKQKDAAVKHLFGYLKGAIIKQDKDLLMKYLLMGQFVDKYTVQDIVHNVVDTLVCLLLL